MFHVKHQPTTSIGPGVGAVLGDQETQTFSDRVFHVKHWRWERSREKRLNDAKRPTYDWIVPLAHLPVVGIQGFPQGCAVQRGNPSSDQRE